MTRYAKIAAAPERIAPYLPDNYKVRSWTGKGGTSTFKGSTIIEGEDVAGWTLDGYVLPRLASGLYFGEEIFPFEVVARAADFDAQYEAYAERDEEIARKGEGLR